MKQVRWLTDTERRAWRGMQVMDRHLDAELARRLTTRSGLSHQDYMVLVVLTGTTDGAMRLFELCRALGWEKSRSSHHITRMAKRGLVTKEKCASDGRGSSVVVTDHGRSAIEAAAPGYVTDVREFFIDQLSPDELDVITAVAERVLARIHADDPDDDTDSIGA